MKTCPKCNVVFDDELNNCPSDGFILEQFTQDKMELQKTKLGPADIKDTPPVILHQKQAFTEEDQYVGKIIGGLYKIIRKLGEGGMGAVYIVEHVNLKKNFALKMLSNVTSKHPQAVARLKQEAITTSKIEHDNIINVINLDQTEDGIVYIVMELLKGSSLDQIILNEKRLSVERSILIVIQICKALHAAHEVGVVHRDLKPENVFITQKDGADFVKILDFGISLLKDQQKEGVRLTKTGQVLGTPLYMSPEQAQGVTDLDIRVDIYSLGVLFYEMISGVTPFCGDNYFQLLWQHVSEQPPSLRASVPDAHIPEEIEKIILKALCKDRNRRFSTMKELEEAIVQASELLYPELLTYTSIPTYRDSEIKNKFKKGKSLKKLIYSFSGVLIIIIAFLLGFFIYNKNHKINTTMNIKTAQKINNHENNIEKTNNILKNQTKTETQIQEEIIASIDSTPSSAKIYRDNSFLGATPYLLKLNKSSEKIYLEIKKGGYLTEKVEILPQSNINIIIKLRKIQGSKNKRQNLDINLPIKTKI